MTFTAENFLRRTSSVEDLHYWYARLDQIDESAYLPLEWTHLLQSAKDAHASIREMHSGTSAAEQFSNHLVSILYQVQFASELAPDRKPTFRARAARTFLESFACATREILESKPNGYEAAWETIQALMGFVISEVEGLNTEDPRIVMTTNPFILTQLDAPMEMFLTESHLGGDVTDSREEESPYEQELSRGFATLGGTCQEDSENPAHLKQALESAHDLALRIDIRSYAPEIFLDLAILRPRQASLFLVGLLSRDQLLKRYGFLSLIRILKSIHIVITPLPLPVPRAEKEFTRDWLDAFLHTEHVENSETEVSKCFVKVLKEFYREKRQAARNY
jgi:hypothetical protein